MTERSLAYRIGAGKGIGLLFGLLGFFALPLFMHEPTMLLRVGILLSHVRVGLKPSPSGEGFSMISFVHAKALQEIES